MPDKKERFSLEDSDRMIKDVIDTFFQGENITHDIEELGQVQGGMGVVTPEGIEQQEVVE